MLNVELIAIVLICLIFVNWNKFNKKVIILATCYLQEPEVIQINSNYLVLKLFNLNLLCHDGSNSGKHIRKLILELQHLDKL